MLECVRAYNDFLIDWCSADSNRLIPVAAMPFWDVNECVKEIERAMEKEMLEAIPAGPTLLIHIHDQPGVVGMVVTILGEGGINISRMQLALVPERSEAAMLVNIDGMPSAEVMERLSGLAQVISAQIVDLGS